MPVYKGVVEYDGTDYSGWQRQSNSNSIQQTIEEALSTILRKNLIIIGSGRTDAGVHALNQVFHFKLDDEINLPPILKSLNSILPIDISVKTLEKTEGNFHSRYSAKSREYIYLISLRKSAFYDRFSWLIYGKIDFEILKRCESIFIGKKDFRAFCKNSIEIDNHVCEVSYSRWFKKKELLMYFIKADRFIHGMVRGIVGCMIDAARGNISYDEIEKLLEERNQSKSPLWAHPKGLILYRVNY